MKPNNKVLISTIYKADNYGAVFQALSLYEAVKSEGKDVYMLDYSPEKIARQFSPFRTYSFKAMAKDVFRYVPRKKMINRFSGFIENNFQEIRYIDAKNERYGLLITGSDQVWNPKIVSFSNDFEGCYFFSEINGENKISYAASLGSHRYNETQSLEFIDYTKSYNSLGIRESDTTEYISECFGLDAINVLDPTLIQSKSFWEEKVTENSLNLDDFILVYFNNITKELSLTVNRLKKLTGKKVVVINNWYARNIDYDIYVRDAGPLEFLELFSKARYIVTNTFHGVCFSINYEKDFLYVDNGVHSNRVDSLMDKVSGKDKVAKRLDLSDSDLMSKLNAKIDYDKLEKEKERSLNYLYEFL